ncbi:MAG: hypothetical protein IBX57_00100 [Gammaproteobacteria bacterium]|nr:hypothetical protein [Gammaproteobacteria bacterium]
MIESVLYPYTDFPYDNIHREFSLYGIDRNVSEGVIGDLSVMAYRLVGWYKRQFTSYDEHVFDVIVKDANCVQIAYLGIARVQSQQSLEEQLKQQIMSDMDNGHFIPEKTRHLAGVY